MTSLRTRSGSLASHARCARTIVAAYNVRRLPVIGLVGAAVLAAIAVPDLSRSAGLAIVEFAIAGAVVLVSAGSFTGVYHQARSDHAG